LQGLLEEEWAAAQQDAVKRLDIVQMASFVFLGYARASHGEEITKIELGGVRKYFADGALKPKHVFFDWTLQKTGGKATPFSPSCSAGGAHLWCFEKGRESSQSNLIRGSLGGKIRMDSAKHHRNHPSHSKFVGVIWGENINTQRGYYRSTECRH
jgi:hypothetical protein